jgi:heme/copper-type cytochrome/quinol oxidase subunit 1
MNKLSLPAPGRYTAAWLKLGVTALIAAGIFSLLLVLSRVPGISNHIPWIDFFHTALVVHVNLSVLIWFMTFSCLLWGLYGQNRYWLAERLAFYLCAAGMVLLIASAFVSDDPKPLINNYIPVLQQPVFFAGLSLFGSGMLIQILRVLAQPVNVFSNKDSISYSILIYISAITSFVTCLALAWTWNRIPAGLDPTSYYEFLFWAPGHILQFSHTALVLLAWLVLAGLSGFAVTRKPVSLFAWLLIIPVPVALWMLVTLEPVSLEHRLYFTDLMKYGGLVSLPLGLVVAWSLFRRSGHIECAACRSALLSSVMLFLAGGIIGFLIHGINVVIPAHYHGSIVGVTLAFMGIAYMLLPQMGFRKPDWTIARIQPWVYGIGQFMHILGLAWSGGYGVQRKTAGAAQNLENLPEILGMGLMGLGGLISVIGGVLFLIVVIKSMWGKQAQK